MIYEQMLAPAVCMDCAVAVIKNLIHASLGHWHTRMNYGGLVRSQ